jgi:hypothetical protein
MIGRWNTKNSKATGIVMSNAAASFSGYCVPCPQGAGCQSRHSCGQRVEVRIGTEPDEVSQLVPGALEGQDRRSRRDEQHHAGNRHDCYHRNKDRAAAAEPQAGQGIPGE